MPQTITIDIYSDTICPWCYIGHNKLQTAISEYNKIIFNIIWRPFQLNPDMPVEGMERQKYLDHKFGGKDNAKKIYDDIYKAGKEIGIYFQFDKITVTPNSFASHKLLAFAYKLNKQNEVINSLFFSYFIEGKNIGDKEILINIAKQHHIFNIQTSDYFFSNKDNNSLLNEEKHAKELGIKGVPCFIINKKFVLYGAQTKENFIKIFDSISDV